MMNKLNTGILITAFVGILVVSFFFAGEKSELSSIKIGDKTWSVEVVSSISDRSRGLSGREFLEKDSGLLFIFPKEDVQGIWMKEMNFAIDIIWVNEDFKVVGIKKDATPDTYPTVFRSEAPVLYVLEINTGEADMAKIEIGTLVEIFTNTP